MRNKTIIIRWILLLAGITFTILCRFIPNIAEWYARMIYPTLSAAMSAFSSLFPFSLEELLVVGLILWIILYPIWKRKKVIVSAKRYHHSGVSGTTVSV